MKRSEISHLLTAGEIGVEVLLKAWVRTFRSKRFVALNDGSTINNIQAVIDFENTDEETLKKITTGAAVSVSGKLVASQGSGQEKC